MISPMASNDAKLPSPLRKPSMLHNNGKTVSKRYIMASIMASNIADGFINLIRSHIHNYVSLWFHILRKVTCGAL